MATTRARWRRRTAVVAAALAVLGCATTTLAGGVASAAPRDSTEGLGYDPVTDKGSLWHIAKAVGAHASYKNGLTGKGVGVALIDTGVTEVRGLDTGNVFHGPDLSFDSQDPELAHKDAYGHGTHLASIIAGRDVEDRPRSYIEEGRFNGIAPDAHLLSVKVGASDGAVDVSQVIAAIDWVVEHRNDNGMNIRVINLSYGTDSLQDPAVDPLVHAVEQAWRAGIVVVVAGGNDGSDNYNLANPARSPYVLAVGADDTQGTADPADDLVPSWGTRGTNTRHVDVVAPGVSVLGLRVPNGYADERNPHARVGTRFARASGTSQAAAVVSGEVALLLQALPGLTPDQVKQQLRVTAHPFASASYQYRGNGVTDVRSAQTRPETSAKQPEEFYGTGTGSLEAARGSSHVNDGVTELRGEIDIFGNPWDGSSWALLSAAGDAWVGGTWRGATWSGDGWNAKTWRDVAWSSGTWSAKTWRDAEWSSRAWRNGTWTGTDWSAKTWRDALWSAKTWREADLASAGWLSRTRA
ncbi:MAG: Peptidase S8 and S53, subtilisin, kexin, sedolisin [uncultured Nocardioidaceae bacterium]|uniref:Peptidase S8 and S53, subtilisin, kexin, sedolisin n=1 Tax=uncultured Nocardioidaceae bacterium TaxID=253824 RepID=A0A6J4M5V2_9ACTN|nr:MAG: Peptidase S8 and S53, subtilisin, kexin, sedolisin [uncultured Nocardioidaceae bacterium]